MSFSELQMLTDIANRSDFYSERDEFNTILKLNEEVDASIEDLYTLYDIVEKGEDLTSLESFVGADLKRLTGKSEVSMEGLSVLVIVGIVALLGAIIALLVWVIRSFSQTGSSIAATRNNINKLVEDINRGTSDLRPSQEFDEAAKEILGDLQEVLEGSGRKDDETSGENNQRAAKAAEDVVNKVVAEAKPEEVAREINLSDSTQQEVTTREEVKEDSIESRRSMLELQKQAIKDLTEEAKGVINSNETEYRDRIKNVTLEYESQVHEQFKKLKKKLDESYLPLFGDNYILDPKAIVDILHRLNAAFPHISHNLKSVGQIISEVDSGTEKTFLLSGDIYKEIIENIEHDRQNGTRDYPRLSEYIEDITKIIEKRNVNKGVNAGYWNKAWLQKILHQLESHRDTVMRLLGSSSGSCTEAYEKTLSIPSQCLKDVEVLVCNGPCLYISDFYRKLVDNAIEVLRKEMPAKIRDIGAHGFNELSFKPRFVADLYTKMVISFLKVYQYQSIPVLDITSAITYAESLRISVQSLSSKFDKHIKKYDSMEDAVASRYKQIIMPMMKPYLNIVTQCKSIVSISIDAITVLKKMDSTIREGFSKAHDALSKALRSASASANDTLDVLALEVAGQLTKWLE